MRTRLAAIAILTITGAASVPFLLRTSTPRVTLADTADDVGNEDDAELEAHATSIAELREPVRVVEERKPATRHKAQLDQKIPAGLFNQEFAVASFRAPATSVVSELIAKQAAQLIQSGESLSALTRQPPERIGPRKWRWTLGGR